RKKFAIVTPGTSLGYWKLRKSPLRARSSGSSSKRFSPSINTSPLVTLLSGCPAITLANVLLPEPFGPMTACSSPKPTERLRSRTISFSPMATRKFLISSCCIKRGEKKHSQFSPFGEGSGDQFSRGPGRRDHPLLLDWTLNRHRPRNFRETEP